MIYLIGSNGNMGRRYSAILDSLNLNFVSIDLDTHVLNDRDLYTNYRPTHVIIATPSDTHLSIAMEFDEFTPSILCEKPLITNEEDLSLLLEIRSPLYMVNNYDYIVPTVSDGSNDTHFDFYNTGKDGLIFDCCQIIQRAKGSITLNRASPTWNVKINGDILDVASINESYVLMISDFITNQMQRQDKDDLYNFHYSLIRMNQDYEEKGNKNFYRYTSKNNEHSFAWQDFNANRKYDRFRALS